MQIKRITAEKASAKEIAGGRFVKKSGFESSYVLTDLGRRLSRVRVLGVIVDKYLKEGGTYGSITIDDSSETVRCKVFITTKVFDGVTPGDLVDVFGKVKEYNGEVYVMPEIIRKVSPNYETLRLVEIEEIHKSQRQLVEKMRKLGTKDLKELNIALKGQADEDAIAAVVEAGLLDEIKVEIKPAVKSSKDMILKLIEESGGIDYLTIIEKSGLDENIVDQIIQELLENKTCFEPSPGVIKVL